MKKYIDGRYVDTTPEEITAAAKAEAEYWQSVDYSAAVDSKIRERYSASQEFAILRQKDEKPDEFATYYNYCEECKRFVKGKKRLTEVTS